MILVFIFSLSTSAAFKETQKRYLAPHDFILTLQKTFPIVQASHPGNIVCTSLTEPYLSPNRTLTGDNSPVSGTPVSSTPNFLFVKWYKSCLMSRLNESVPEALAGKRSQGKRGLPYLPSSFLEELELRSKKPEMAISAEDLTTSDRDKVFNHLIDYILGGDAILSDFGLTTRKKLLAKLHKTNDMNPRRSLRELIIEACTYLALRDEFLSY